ncbi:MAG: DUF1841 family protein [Jiangellaceae bacterium]
MSPVSRGRKKKKKSRSGRAQRQSPIAILDGLHRTIVDGFRPLAHTRDPFEVEMFTSGLLGTLPNAKGVGFEPDEALLLGLVSYCERRRSPQSIAALHALRVLATSTDVRGAASDTIAMLDVPAPPWAGAIGNVELRECWRMADVYGDQADVTCVFGYGNQRHALCYLVDFNHMGGWVKDVFPIDEPDAVLTEMRKSVEQSDGIATVTPLDPAEARHLLERGFQATETTWEPDVADTFSEFRALGLARCRALPDTASEQPDLDEVSDHQRERLVEEFLASDEAAALSSRESAAYGARLIVDYGCDYDESQPLRVSPAKIEIFMLGWLPKKVLLDDDDKAAMPAVVTAWTRWAARRNNLPPAAAAEVVEAAEEIGRHFADEYDDPANASPGRLLLRGLDNVGSLDEVQGALERRTFAMPYFGTRIGDEVYPMLDPNDPDERGILIEGEHPEYHAALADPSFHGEIDGVNPGLHVAFHEIVAHQLWDDDPPEAWRAAQRLRDQGHERHDILHALAHVVATDLHGTLTTGQAVDDAAYRQALEALGRGKATRRKAAARPRASTAAATAYQVKIGIRGASPPIWRRLQVPAETTLAQLHHVIQAAFGWKDSHLHHFRDSADRRYAPTGTESWGDKPGNEAGTRLRDVIGAEGDKLRYEYDFGDSWEHDILVEDVLTDGPRDRAVCLAGRRAGPIEDSGGVWGYDYLCEVMADPDHPEHAERRDWVYDIVGVARFDPAAFDKDAVNDALAAVPIGAARR